MSSADYRLEGGCSCGAVRYVIKQAPLVVHACHCRNCQNQTGGWHAVNALVESKYVEQQQGVVADWELPTPSGAGQAVRRCVECGVAVWSTYRRLTRGHDDLVRFVRVGTLDNPSLLRPDVHIFDSERNAMAPEPVGAPRYAQFYSLEEVWRPDSLVRFKALLEALPRRHEERASVAG
ncbi:MAG: GFA family protein [Pseudomonadota bacterium]